MLRIVVWIQVVHLTSLRLNFRGFPVGLVGKESACKAEDAGDACSIPELGRSPAGGPGNPLQYSCLKNGQRKLAGYSPWGLQKVGHYWSNWASTTQAKLPLHRWGNWGTDRSRDFLGQPVRQAMARMELNSSCLLLQKAFREPYTLLNFLKNNLWNGVFPAISINKDVTAINYFNLPNMNFWAQRTPRKNNAC